MDKIPVWKMIKEAANAIEGDAITNAEIKQYISAHFGMVNDATLIAQIIACCVNHPSRVHYPENHKPRIANGSHDFLYRIDRGMMVLYDPNIHGVWEVAIEGGRRIVRRLNGHEMPTPTTNNKAYAPRIVRKKHTHNEIAQPCPEEVMRYLARWETLENYSAQERALNKLFQNMCPTNDNLDDVLLKVATLNTFYSTKIYNPYMVARHIVDLNIDERLDHGYANLIADIASGHGVKNSKGGKEITFYSFATKYCSHHKQQLYPIYDSYVEDVLIHLNAIDGFASFTTESLRDFCVFRDTLFKLQKFYSLESFSLKEIDQYLWQLGKEKFPNVYGRRKND